MRKNQIFVGYVQKQMIKNGVLTHLNTIHSDRLWEKFDFNIKEGNVQSGGGNYFSWQWNWYYVYNAWRTLRLLEPT
jgi:hypothetical protein